MYAIVANCVGFQWDEGNRKQSNMGQEFDQVPAFPNEEEERTFWATHDSTDYLNWDDAEEIVLPKLTEVYRKERIVQELQQNVRR